jgi:hypothetical protein
MNLRKHHPSPRWSVILTVIALFGTAPMILAQEVEPNNICEDTPDFGEVTLPISISGELTPAGDIDFYRFQAEPGTTVEVLLQGEDSGNGTLSDPYLGFFDSLTASWSL